MIALPRNARESIVVALRAYRGRGFIDIRLHYHGDDGDLRPTGKGVTIAPDKAADLADAIRHVAGQGAPDGD